MTESQEAKKEDTKHTYEEAVAASVEYFKGDELAAKVFVDKYALRNRENELLEKTPTDMHRRIAREFARIEKGKFKEPLSEEDIFELIDGFKFVIPQGSPMSGIGNEHQAVSLSNCFVVPSPLDSYGSIMNTDQELVQISKRRGGVGVDLSNLRPAGTSTNNAARSSTGIVSFMERYSNTIREVGQAARRGALMETLDVRHIQAEDFATIKNDDTKVTGANISLKLFDEFLDAVENDTEFTARWPIDNPVVTERKNAKELWDKIIHSAWKRAEPGLLFWDNIIRESPADCYSDVGFKSVCCNPCSELVLSEYDSCRLLVLNLFSYVIKPFTDDAYFDYDLFSKHAQTAQRLMDDLVDMELECIDRILAKVMSDPEAKHIKDVELNLWEKIRIACENGRRTGTGITALGDTIAALGLSYGSPQSIDTAANIYRTLKLNCYRSSVEMAKEIGAFPVWNREKEKNCDFLLRIKDEDEELYNDMRKYGRRNIALLTIAPTGSVSILAQTSSGVEPLFMLHPYTRRKKVNQGDQNVRIDFVDKSGDSWQEFEVYHPKVAKWMEITGNTDIDDSPWFGCCAPDLDWVSRVDLQAAMQKHCDHAISSTINLPENVSEDKVAAIYTAAWKSGCKGITVYRDNCRTGVLVTKKDQTKDSHWKRPKELPCDVYHPTIRGQDYFVIIGLKDKKPFEVFSGKNGFFSKSVKSGKIRKEKRGQYNLIDLATDDIVIDNITGYLKDEEEAITRMLSMSLRHEVDLAYIVHQLEKVDGDLNSLSKVTARTLKKYIKDGSKVAGEDCGECGQPTLERKDGCVVCMSCGWSKC